MAFDFKNAYNNLFAKPTNALNRSANRLIGKEVFGELRMMEAERTYQPYDTFPPYSIPEPQAWSPQEGKAQAFSLNGNTINVSEALDSCLRCYPFFETAATYYMQRFQFRYRQCVYDFDTLLHYFNEMYYEGLLPMLKRAYSLLLPFGVFSVSFESFFKEHAKTYHLAVTSYCTMAGIEESKNQAAVENGYLLGNSVQLQGGGFGAKGAARGILAAESFNAGMRFLGQILTNEERMSQEEKQRAYSAFRSDVFFKEVYFDYCDSFYSMVQTLANNGIIPGLTTKISGEISTVLENLQNPLFPSNHISAALAKIITTNPFIPIAYKIMRQRLGETEEVKTITEYFRLGSKR